jgi:methyl-accepting chemotaxis protein
MTLIQNILTHFSTSEAVVVSQEELSNLRGQIAAISKSQAVIEFNLDGTIIYANDNFLKTFGYSLDEVKGKHHSIFIDSNYRASFEYRQFWDKLGRGEYDAGQYKRITKSGHEVWIQASYNPIVDSNNRPFKVVKYATDITAEKNKNADYEGQIAAISTSQAVIEFNLDGTILNANDNFLKTLGYTLNEIKGQHHSMFVDTAYRNSEEYRQFWRKLSNGEYESSRFPRISKSGKIVWIQASYNPIKDLNGRPYKVVKYATDITAQVNAENLLRETVNEIQKVIGAASDSDFSLRVDSKGKTGDLLALSEGINSLLDSMSEIFEQIKIAADTIFTASSEIAQGNADLSSRTEQQAANLEETASSMEELTSTVRLNADNAKQANVLAEKASSVAVDGGSLIQQVVVTMGDINKSAQKISDIIGVIDGIAFQTNILALNAAVEAARAGDQGRGFAVVASEVRTLAQRSANAAKDIKALINDSVQKIASGNSLVSQSGDTMKEIVNSIKRVNDIMSEIAAASNEQSTGIEEVSNAVSQMDEMTQQNAALVEQAAAAAESLQSQADQLTSSVAKFKLINQHSHSGFGAPQKRSTSPSVSFSTTQTKSTQIIKKSKPTPTQRNAEDEWETF